MHLGHDARDARLVRSEEVGYLIDNPRTSLPLRRKPLRKFMTVTLATSLEVKKVVHVDAAITAHMVEGDLTAVEKLVEMGPTAGEAV